LHPPVRSAAEFRALFDQQVDFVWRVLRRYGVPDREIEDACQEVFLIVHRKLGEFEGRSSLRTWIYAIAARVAQVSRRKAYFRRESLESPAHEPHAEANQEELATQSRALTLVDQVLTGMDPEKREAFVLYELEGMSVAEVASAVGVPENTALYRLQRAREELAQRLKRAAVVPATRAREPRLAGGNGA
jgi:RNA polymerase sigma-70 factor (ECF subfamily)